MAGLITTAPTADQLNQFNSLIKSGDTAGAYKLGSGLGYTDDQMAWQVNKDFGTNLTGTQVAGYKPTTQSTGSGAYYWMDGKRYDGAPPAGATGIFAGVDETGQGYSINSLGQRINTYDNGVQPGAGQTAQTGATGAASTTGTGLISSVKNSTFVNQAQDDPNKYDLMDAYRAYYDRNLKGSGVTWDQYLQQNTASINTPYLENFNRAANAYYAGANHDQAKWDAMQAAAGDQWGEYSQYIKALPKATPGGGAGGGLIHNTIDRTPSAEEGRLTNLAYKGGNFTSEVDPETMTIQGRMSNLLSTDATGKFNTPAIRQAAEAARQAFAGRGLLNSSMAEQAASEAAISKAIEIAGPDADKYFQNMRGNVDWFNKFGMNEMDHRYDLEKMDQGFANDKEMAALGQTYKKELMALENSYTNQNVDKQYGMTLQQNYLQAVGNLQSQYDRQVQLIQNNNSLTPEAKQAALDNLGTLFENQRAITSSTFEAMPAWNKEWSAIKASFAAPQAQATPPATVDIPKMTDQQLKDLAASDSASDADLDAAAKELLKRGVITQQQYDQLYTP